MAVQQSSGLDTRRPFTRADALAAGISPKQLRGSRFRRVFRGVYVRADVLDHPLIRAQAALLLHPADAVASHFSAARVYGLPVPAHALEHVTVTGAGDRTRVEGIRCHVARLEASEVVVVDGVPVSAPARMFVELASVLDPVDLVVVEDALVRLRRITPAELVAYCAASTDKHAAAARRAAGYVRRRVDSAMETRLRMLLVLAGLPEPAVNTPIHDERGRPLFRFDLSYPDLRLIVEYDGRQHADDDGQWLGDLHRREWLDDHGLKILVVTSRGIYRHPERTVDRVARNLRERGCRTLPNRLSDAWRPHFPTR